MLTPTNRPKVRQAGAQGDQTVATGSTIVANWGRIIMNKAKISY